MRRIRLHTSKRIALTAAAVSAVSIAAAGGTYANFTATPVTISNNAFAAGTLEMDRSGSGAVFSAAPFGPLPKDYGTNRKTIQALFKPTS